MLGMRCKGSLVWVHDLVADSRQLFERGLYFVCHEWHCIAVGAEFMSTCPRDRSKSGEEQSFPMFFEHWVYIGGTIVIQCTWNASKK